MAKRNYYLKDNGKTDEMKGHVFIFSYHTLLAKLLFAICVKVELTWE